MDIKLEVAFQEVMEEVNDLSKRLILERSIRKQLEDNIKELIDKNREMEYRLKEMKETMMNFSQQNE